MCSSIGWWVGPSVRPLVSHTVGPLVRPWFLNKFPWRVLRGFSSSKALAYASSSLYGGVYVRSSFCRFILLGFFSTRKFFLGGAAVRV